MELKTWRLLFTFNWHSSSCFVHIVLCDDAYKYSIHTLNIHPLNWTSFSFTVMSICIALYHWRLQNYIWTHIMEETTKVLNDKYTLYLYSILYMCFYTNVFLFAYLHISCVYVWSPQCLSAISDVCPDPILILDISRISAQKKKSDYIGLYLKSHLLTLIKSQFCSNNSAVYK